MTSTTAAHAVPSGAERETRRHGPKAVIFGLVARGVLYLLLAFVTLQLVVGHASEQVDTRGALHTLAGSVAGSITLAALALGFIGFAVWNALDAVMAGSGDDAKPARRIADVARAALYVGLAVGAIGVLVSGRAGNSDQKGRTWTATVLGWTGGRFIVAAAGIGVIVAGGLVVSRVMRGKPVDQRSVVEATPNEPSALRVLGTLGNVARGGVEMLIGGFVLFAAIDFDPDKTVGLDGALKRVLDESYGPALIVAVAAGFAAYGVYSLARAWVNRAVAQR